MLRADYDGETEVEVNVRTMHASIAALHSLTSNREYAVLFSGAHTGPGGSSSRCSLNSSSAHSPGLCR